MTMYPPENRVWRSYPCTAEQAEWYRRIDSALYAPDLDSDHGDEHHIHQTQDGGFELEAVVYHCNRTGKAQSPRCMHRECRSNAGVRMRFSGCRAEAIGLGPGSA